jgi:hypothetical protein
VDESIMLLSIADATSFDEFALANEKNTTDKDIISAMGKRCFFMVIGGFSIIGDANVRRKNGVKKEQNKH